MKNPITHLLQYRIASIVLLAAVLLSVAPPVQANAPSYWIDRRIIEGDSETEQQLKPWLGATFEKLESVIRKRIIHDRNFRDGRRIGFHHITCENPFVSTVACRVRVAETGALSTVDVITSSGDTALDELVCAVIYESGPFTAPPNKLPSKAGIIIVVLGSPSNKTPGIEIRTLHEPSGGKKNQELVGAAIERNDANAREYLSIGQSYESKNEFDTALTHYEKALAVKNTSAAEEAQIYLAIASLKSKMGNMWGALAAYRWAFYKNPQLRNNAEIEANIQRLLKPPSH